MSSYANAITPEIEDREGEGVNKLEVFKLSAKRGSFLVFRRTPKGVIKKIATTLNNTHTTTVSAIPRNTR